MLTIAFAVIGVVILFDLYALMLVCKTLVHSFKNRHKNGKIIPKSVAFILVGQLYVFLIGLIGFVTVILIATYLP